MFLYLGDDDMSGAAAYLAGIMLHHGIPFQRIDGTQHPGDDFLTTWYDAYILSDYPRAGFRPGQLERIRDAVRDGAGLLMIGGWESFHGRLGEYHQTVLAEVLPVEMERADDRCNFFQPVIVYREQEHAILEGLPWHRPPFVVGLNRFRAKPESRTLLRAACSSVRITEEDRPALSRNDSSFGSPRRLTVALPNGSALLLTLKETFPMLVVGNYGQGRTAALATDVAPHWVGGMVDWGKQRFTQDVPGGGSIEVGVDYARFFAQLVRWTGRRQERGQTTDDGRQ